MSLRACCTSLILIAISLTISLRGADPAPSHAFEKSIVAFEQRDQSNPPPRDANLFIGSSSIVKWKTLAADFPHAAVINRGFGGSRIPDSIYYANRIVIPYHPKRIFLYAGDNDLASKRTPEQVAADFKTFVETVRAGLPDVAIHFISIKPSPVRAKLLEQARSANQLIEAYIKQGKNMTFIDVFTPMLGPDGQARPELFGPDKLHMNEAGYALWTKIMSPMVN